jgi:hypothetical protein
MTLADRPNSTIEFWCSCFMNPFLYARSVENDPFLDSIIACITSIDCETHFANHLGKSQREQAALVQIFQKILACSLAVTFPRIAWSLEYLPDRVRKDAIDIFGKSNETTVVIELDKHRADQVAKKFVSRSAMFKSQNNYYISLCYPGTDRMNFSECVKYLGYCADLCKRMGNTYAGFIIQDT